MESEILTMAEFSKRRREDYPAYSIIHSLWILEDGRKVDCALFKEKGYCGIQKFSIGDKAELSFQSSSSGKVYLREIRTPD